MVFASHHWPTWGGRDKIVEFLSLQRDLYAYLHDQTLRQLNQGYTGIEIAEGFQMPPALHKAWHAHGYYGSVSHNVKAVYQRYMGWFDGNPARLWLIRRKRSGHVTSRRWVAPTGWSSWPVRPPNPVTTVGRQRYWITSSSPTNSMRAPGSSTPTPSTSWRTAPSARRGATSSYPVPPSCATETSARPPRYRRRRYLPSSPPEQMFDVLAISVNGPRSWDLDISLDVTFADLDANYRLTLRNGVLVYRQCPADESTATATIRLATKLRLFLAAAAGDFTSPGLEITGDPQALQTFLGALDQPDPSFNIITP